MSRRAGWVGDAELLRGLGDGGLADLGVIVDADDLKALRGVLLAELLEPGHLVLAGWAVGGPEVEDERVALVVGEGDLFAVEADEVEGRRGFAAEGFVDVGGGGGDVVLDEVDAGVVPDLRGADALAVVEHTGDDDECEAEGHRKEQERFAQHGCESFGRGG